MPKQVTFEARFISILDVSAYHEDIESALRLFFASTNPQFAIRFFGKTLQEIDEELADRLNETELRSSLAILGQVEAAFRIDYKERCKKRKRDTLSKAFRDLYKKKRENVKLEEQILMTWREAHPQTGQLISQLGSRLNKSTRRWRRQGKWKP